MGEINTFLCIIKATEKPSLPLKCQIICQKQVRSKTQFALHTVKRWLPGTAAKHEEMMTLGLNAWCWLCCLNQGLCSSHMLWQSVRYCNSSAKRDGADERDKKPHSCREGCKLVISPEAPWGWFELNNKKSYIIYIIYNIIYTHI